MLIEHINQLSHQQIDQYHRADSPVVYDDVAFMYLSRFDAKFQPMKREVAVRVTVTTDRLVQCRAVEGNALLWAGYVGDPNKYRVSALYFYFLKLNGEDFPRATTPFFLVFSRHFSAPYLGAFYMPAGFRRRSRFMHALRQLGAPKSNA